MMTRTVLHARIIDYRSGIAGPPTATLQLDGGDRITLVGEPWMLEAMKKRAQVAVTVEAIPDDWPDDDAHEEWK